MVDQPVYDLDKPGYYRIWILGDLGDSWSSWISGMTITRIKNEDGSIGTTLCGYLADQAGLIGLLNTLYNLGYTLIRVERQSLPEA